MRHVDAMMFSRWTVASVLMVAPLVVGCGAKTGTEQDTPHSSASQQPLTASSVDASPGLGSPIDLESPGRQPPADPPVSAANAVADKPAAETPTVVISDGDGPNEADRPRSLFRSIGRALKKGVTDAAGATSDPSNDTPESVESEPTDPR
ncbi:MAG TPA: hypothetical protein QF564_08815 [Pirellulaceae bacterium]|jgi:hypothetical protein|nr:hypothetical protein [Pirellulaceae bacterium]